MKKTVKWLLRCSIALGVFLAAMNFGSVTAEARVPKVGEKVLENGSANQDNVASVTKLKYTTTDTKRNFYAYIICTSRGYYIPSAEYSSSICGWVLNVKCNTSEHAKEYLESTKRLSAATEADVQGIMDGGLNNCDWADDEDDDEDDNDDEEEELKDSDTYKSCLPAKSIMARSAANASHIDDLKVHELSASDAANQKFLADSFATKGKNVKIIASFGVFPRRDLAIGENGSAQTLIWNNLSYKTPNTVHAVCYNTTDGAYVINGTIDDKGVAVLTGFKLRPATNVTLYVEE